MTQITPQFKLAAFMAYPNGAILDEQYSPEPICIDHFFQCFDRYINVVDIDSAKILLTPLSEITDEHLIGLHRILHPKDIIHDSAMGKFICDDFKRNDVFFLKAFNILKIIDFFREHNYAIPFRGVDLIEAGIAMEIIMQRNIP